MGQIDKTKLMRSISQLGKIDAEILTAVVREIQDAGIEYKVSYGEYQSGGWYTTTLYKPADKAANNEITDGHAIPTAIMEKMPITKKLFEELGLEYFAIRIAKAVPDAFLWEHRDYIELGEEEKLRLHIPLVTNADANIQFSECSVHMAAGNIWKLDPTVSHAIANKGDTDRIHLILDCYLNDKLKAMIAKEMLDDENVAPLPAFSAEDSKRVFEMAGKLLREQGVHVAEDYLLKTFHAYDLGELFSYDLLIDFYKGEQFFGRETHWIQEKITRMIMREKHASNAPISSIRGDFFEAAHANQNIPQYGLMAKILKLCAGIDGLEQAFLRGSLSRGDADAHSDIDLLCVVPPAKFEAYIKSVQEMINSKYPDALPGWTDTIVKDFGGVGFVWLIEHEGRIHQLDLYIACEGNPALERLRKLPAKQEVYRAKSDRKTTPAQEGRLIEQEFKLNAQHIFAVIKGINDTPDTPERTLVELAVLGVMIKKCLSRNNSLLAANEFNMWKKALVKLARLKADPDLKDYGLYHVERLEYQMGDGGKFYRDLIQMNAQPLTLENFVQYHEYAMRFAQQYHPNAFDGYKTGLEQITQEIQGALPAQTKSTAATKKSIGKTPGLK